MPHSTKKVDKAFASGSRKLKRVFGAAEIPVESMVKDAHKNLKTVFKTKKK